jgi:sporulation protein YlmC with PRC-barrel domain
MRLGRDLENKPIVTISDGRILGRVKDFYVDQNLSGLAGLFIGTEGVIRRKDRIIPSEGIILLGIDVILVKNADVITTSQALPASDDWLRLSDLKGREVHTPGGTKLATIDDVTLDEQGAVTGFTLFRVFVSGPLADKSYVPREVLVDTFQRSDALLVDFPKLEAMFGGQEKGESAAVPGAPGQSGGAVIGEEETPSEGE